MTRRKLLVCFYALYCKVRNILVRFIWLVPNHYESLDLNIFDWAVRTFSIFPVFRQVLIWKGSTKSCTKGIDMLGHTNIFFLDDFCGVAVTNALVGTFECSTVHYPCTFWKALATFFYIRGMHFLSHSCFLYNSIPYFFSFSSSIFISKFCVQIPFFFRIITLARILPPLSPLAPFDVRNSVRLHPPCPYVERFQ